MVCFPPSVLLGSLKYTLIRLFVVIKKVFSTRDCTGYSKAMPDVDKESEAPLRLCLQYTATAGIT